MLTIGYDIGSSSIKATLFDTDAGRPLANATVPDVEMPILSPAPGFAEQDPDLWWQCVCEATKRLATAAPGRLRDVRAIGISYQMHGLVLVDKDRNVLMPSIIWCDSRAAGIGRSAFERLGPDWCLSHLLNSPGNFTASKLRWVIAHRPDIYERTATMLLPGDFIALRLTGETTTTIPGLSEEMLWDFPANAPANDLLRHYGARTDVLARIVPTFGAQGFVSSKSAELLGIPPGIPVAYRAGDQPNNALSLNVLEPGEVASTAGTSGVVYAVSGDIKYDPISRINSFAHVNHAADHTRIGILLCVNGTGIANSWMRRITGHVADSYASLNEMATAVPVGSNGIVFLPFGNGAERMFENKIVGAHLCNVDFTRHGVPDMLRAVQEGVAFSLAYGLAMMPSLGVKPTVIRAGSANMFLSPIFCETLATVCNVPIELFSTDGAQGAARGAAVGAGIYGSLADAATGLERRSVVEPQKSISSSCRDAFAAWNQALASRLTA